VIRVDAAWFAVEALDMRAGVDTALARVVSVFGEARAHHAYLFINKRANRLKVLVHDGFGLWLCARRLYEGTFIRASVTHFRFAKDGVSGYPVRHLADISDVLNQVFANAMLVFRHVLGFYRNDELPAFGRLYVAEWRQPFLNIPHVKIEFVEKPTS
jgi:hypothetical protein